MYTLAEVKKVGPCNGDEHIYIHMCLCIYIHVRVYLYTYVIQQGGPENPKAKRQQTNLSNQRKFRGRNFRVTDF